MESVGNIPVQVKETSHFSDLLFSDNKSYNLSIFLLSDYGIEIVAIEKVSKELYKLTMTDEEVIRWSKGSRQEVNSKELYNILIGVFSDIHLLDDDNTATIDVNCLSIDFHITVSLHQKSFNLNRTFSFTLSYVYQDEATKIAKMMTDFQQDKNEIYKRDEENNIKIAEMNHKIEEIRAYDLQMTKNVETLEKQINTLAKYIELNEDNEVITPESSMHNPESRLKYLEDEINEIKRMIIKMKKKIDKIN